MSTEEIRANVRLEAEENPYKYFPDEVLVKLLHLLRP